MKPNWNDYFMNIAIEVASRSTDPVKKVGSVLVDNENNRIVSTGYNALPSNFPENINWNDRVFAHQVVIHAECNTLLYCKSKFKNTTLYCTLSPCIECLKMIKASNINTVYYKEKYKNFELTQKIANMFRIELIQL